MSRRARIGLAVLLVAGLAGLGIVVLATAGGSGPPAAVRSGQRAPAFTARTATGRVDLGALRGHVAVLAFVQAGCGSCADELRSFAKLAPATPRARFRR